MNKFVCGSATFLLVLGMFVHEGKAILCWECNSAHDPRCGEYNFDAHTLGTVDCDQLEREHLKGQPAKYCRKIIQNIGDETRTIRGCGWYDDTKARESCYKRTGTKDVMVTFCQCEGDKCNAAPRSSPLVGNLVLASVPLLILVKLF